MRSSVDMSECLQSPAARATELRTLRAAASSNLANIGMPLTPADPRVIFLGMYGGEDGARTRNLCRDRA